MNLRKLSLSVFSALLGILIFPTISQAITITSHQINKVSVSFIASEDANILKGKVWKRASLDEAVKVKLELFDSQKALILRKEVTAPESQKKENYWEMDFDLDLTGKNLNGEYVLKAEILNDTGRSFAFGEGVKSFLEPTAGESREISLVSDLTPRVDKDLVKGGIKFVNNEVDGDFKAKIDIYKDDNERSYIGTFLSESFSIKKGATEEIFFTFTKPVDPQLYQAEVLIIQQEKEITGKLIRPFLVEGDFGEFAEISVSPAKYIEKGETIKVEFSGATTTGSDQVLSVEIELTDNAGFSAKKFVNVTPENAFGEFKGEEIFLATQGVGQIFAKVYLWNGNDELAQISKTTKTFTKPKSISFISKIKEIKTGEKLSNSDKYKIIAILVLILFAIVIFIRGLVRSNKSKNFFIFLAMIIVSGTTFASYPTGHFFPESGMAYNLTEDSNFNKLGFWGYVSTEEGGRLPTSSVDIPYRVILTRGDKEFVSKKMTFENENSYEYKFDFNIKAENFEGDVPSDGKYTVKFILSGDDIKERLSSLGVLEEDGSQATEIKFTFGEDYIFIDSKKPEPNFGFGETVSGGVISDIMGESDFTNTTFGIQPRCGDSGAGCHTNFAGFPVTGNFCIGETYCSTGAHEFKICDIAGNCSAPKSADIKFYDPVKPVTYGGDFVDAARDSIFDDPEWGTARINAVNNCIAAAEEGPSSRNNEVPSTSGIITVEGLNDIIGAHLSVFVECGIYPTPAYDDPLEATGGALGMIRMAISNIYNFSLRGTEDPLIGGTSIMESIDDHVCSRSDEFQVK